MPSILLIDDKRSLLEELEQALRRELDGENIEIRTWVPEDSAEDAHTTFERLVDPDTILVITDHDLTSQGQTGLFGSSIVAWCQQRAIPVGDFSRGNPSGLPNNPDLFELRVPTNDIGAVFIAGVYRGFRDIRDAIASSTELLKVRSPAAALAAILGVADLENEFALYMPRLAPASGALMSRISSEGLKQEEDISAEEKRRVLGYIAGHLLLNSVLRFPGPILSTRALKAFLATNEADDPDILGMLAPARYEGPFSTLDTFHWMEKVETLLNGFLTSEDEAETPGELFRTAVERKLGRAVRRHDCPRCEGVNGGYYCPFTDRTVCQRSNCSVGSSSWIPQGATLCRIERDFFAEWSPILGF